jgi:hypothetical protein
MTILEPEVAWRYALGNDLIGQYPRDEFGPMEELRSLIETLPGPKRLILVDAQDHFFAGSLEKLEETIAGLA